METFTEEQKQTLTETLTRLGYAETEVEIVPGTPEQGEIAMLHVNTVFISSALYALSLTDVELKALIDGAIQAEPA